MTVERRLREFAAPDEAASGERVRAVANAAFAGREQAPRRSRWPRFGVAAAIAALAAIAATAPGSAVADWVRELVAPDAPTEGRAPALTRLPAPGRLLVTGPGGAWVVRRDGGARRIGGYQDATWSPSGLYVAATRGHELSAVEPGGTVHWTLARRERLARPVWSPSGYRIAYRAGAAIRVVAGDGSGDRRLARPAGAAAPAWRPERARHLLAFARPDGAVELRDTDTGRRLWRTDGGSSRPAPSALAWVAGTRRLAVLRGAGLELLDRHGRTLWRRGLPGRGIALAARPGHATVAVSVAGRDGTGQLLLLRAGRRRPAPRMLLASPGAIGEAVFSPDGSTLLVSRPRAGEWVSLPVDGGTARAVGGIARRFDPGAATPVRMPSLRGWER